jgi:uncharacterized protein
MARNVIVDAGFLVALISSRDACHSWAVAQTPQFSPSWHTCEAVLSEAFHLIGVQGMSAMSALLRRVAVVVNFELAGNLDPVLRLVNKYASVPMSFADACIVRMTENLSDCVVLTTDADFRLYRRHGRQIIPSVTPA